MGTVVIFRLFVSRCFSHPHRFILSLSQHRQSFTRVRFQCVADLRRRIAYTIYPPSHSSVTLTIPAFSFFLSRSNWSVCLEIEEFLNQKSRQSKAISLIVHENSNLYSVIRNHVKPVPINHPLKPFCLEPVESLRISISKHPKNPRSPFRELDI
ncbi:hypothetical protein L1887_34255 [Cichorium endivia]|nr:hypothetical protein L1887_34255 [Cichorium endivia]